MLKVAKMKDVCCAGTPVTSQEERLKPFIDDSEDKMMVYPWPTLRFCVPYELAGSRGLIFILVPLLISSQWYLSKPMLAQNL